MDKQKLHNCQKCKRKFQNLTSLMIHTKYAHKNKEQIKINNEARKNNKDELETLVKSKNSSPCICKLCSQTFSTISSLNRHISSVHEKLKKFQCHFCHNFFSQSNNLRDHIIAVHEKLKPHQCSFCNKRCSRKCHLKTHMNSVHKNLKQLVCQI